MHKPDDKRYNLLKTLPAGDLDLMLPGNPAGGNLCIRHQEHQTLPDSLIYDSQNNQHCDVVQEEETGSSDAIH
jgi:hypothetical protein